MSEVEVVDPQGNVGTIDEAQVGLMPPGSRVLGGAGGGEAPSGGHTPIDTGFGVIQGSPLTDMIADRATGILARSAGAARTATFGLSDQALLAGADVVGGESLRQDTLKALNLARESNPYQNMIGEAAGLFMGPGGGVTAAGETAESAVASRLGEGLLGKVGAMGARGAVEGALLGAQHQITEDTLGDHELNGQAVFANAAKDGLLGGVVGGAFGAAGHYAGKALGGLLRRPGPVPDATLDAVAGVEGAGRALKEDAQASQGLIEAAQKAGATTEQAAKMADEVNTLSRTEAESGPLSGMVRDLADGYAAQRAGSNAQMRDVLQEGLATRAERLAKQEEILNSHARAMADKGTQVMRNLEDTVNEVHFTERPDQMAKLVDPAKYSVARDTAVKLGQDVQSVLELLDSTATKGGGDVAIKKLQKQLTDFASNMSKLPTDAAESASGARDAFMSAYKLKQAVGKYAGFGKPQFLRSAAENELAGVYEKLRVGLEDEAVWGGGGNATREWNESFSAAKGRRDDFGRRFSVNVDQGPGGVPRPELDAGKIKGMLGQLGGAEADQAVKSTEEMVSGLRNRMNAIRKYGDLTEGQAAKLAAGEKQLSEFESTFQSAQKESAIVARLKHQQLVEQGHAMGGVVGLIGDMMTRPLTTMERLGEVLHVTQKVEKAISGGLEKFFGKKGVGAAASEAAKVRPRADIAKEIGEARVLAGNPEAMESRVAQLVGDLGKHAPKTADEAKATAKRAILYLAKEAPTPSVSSSLMLMHKAEPRYSDQQLHDWETKRRAALNPQSVVDDMQHGKLNREAIKTVEFVSPRLFAEMQDLARNQIASMQTKGLLDKMPYQQQATIATLLKVPADGTWKPDFISMMQGAKQAPAPQSAPAGPPQPNQGTSKRAVKINTDIYATESAAIEKGRAA